MRENTTKNTNKRSSVSERITTNKDSDTKELHIKLKDRNRETEKDKQRQEGSWHVRLKQDQDNNDMTSQQNHRLSWKEMSWKDTDQEEGRGQHDKRKLDNCNCSASTTTSIEKENKRKIRRNGISNSKAFNRMHCVPPTRPRRNLFRPNSSLNLVHPPSSFIYVFYSTFDFILLYRNKEID